MSGVSETVEIRSRIYKVTRPEGAAWAVLSGRRGGVANAAPTKAPGPLWHVWRGQSETVGWVVPHGPTGVRAVTDQQARLLVKLETKRPDLGELLLRYTDARDIQSFNLALELIGTQGLDAAPSAEDLARTVQYLTS